MKGGDCTGEAARSAGPRVWLLALRAEGPHGLGAARRLLTGDELAACERHRNRADRARSTLGQAALRWLLADHLSREPGEVVVRRAPGRPPTAPGAPGLHLSLAHSGEFVACALAERPVGVDIERTDRPEADPALAARVLTPAERDAVASMPHDRQRAEIVRLWTRKEAVSKALGEGLRLDFATLDVHAPGPLPADPPGRPGFPPGLEERLCVCDLEAPPGYAAAVAAPGSDWIPVLAVDP